MDTEWFYHELSSPNMILATESVQDIRELVDLNDYSTSMFIVNETMLAMIKKLLTFIIIMQILMHCGLRKQRTFGKHAKLTCHICLEV